MKLLLDTHKLLWPMADDPQLSQTALDLLVEPGNELLLSPAEYWELAIRISIRKHPCTNQWRRHTIRAIDNMITAFPDVNISNRALE